MRLGKQQVDQLLTHSLPLFGLADMPGYEELQQESNGDRRVDAVRPKPDTPVIT